MTDAALLIEPTTNVRLLVAYDGTAFSGFARNRDVRTVAGTLEEHLSRIAGSPVTIVGAGRTDKGVHAWGQVVSFRMPTDRLEPARLARALNGLCGPSIAVREVAVVPDDFSARFSARWRRYRYTVRTATAPDPFVAPYVWHVGESLRLDAMCAAAIPLVGEHDFSSFCRRPPARPDGEPASLVRRVLDAEWSVVDDDTLRFEIRASSFCHQMVRSVVGTLVEVGRGRRRAADVALALRARSRAAVTTVAPPSGLCLWDVGY